MPKVTVKQELNISILVWNLSSGAQHSTDMPIEYLLQNMPLYIFIVNFIVYFFPVFDCRRKVKQ